MKLLITQYRKFKFNNKNMFLLILTVFFLLILSTCSFADSELDDVEVLTIDVNSMFQDENVDYSKLKTTVVQNIDFNKTLTDKEYNTDLSNFLHYFNQSQSYLGYSTEDEMKKELNKIIQNKTGRTVADLKFDMDKIIAMTNDGHALGMFNVGSAYLPIKMKIIDDDIYIINTTENYKNLLYSKIISINGESAKSLLDKFYKYVSGENEYFKKAKLESYYLSYIDIYNKENISKNNRLSLELENDGKIQNIDIEAIKMEPTKIFKQYFEGSESKRFVYDINDKIGKKFVQNNKERFTDDEAFYCYEREGSLIVKYNQAADKSDEISLKNLEKNMDSIIKKNNTNKIILDLRYNNGGETTHFRELSRKLQTYQISNPQLEFRVLTDYNSYSAATFLIDDIKRGLNNVTIVGNFTGGPSGWTTSAGSMLYFGNSHLFISSASSYLFRFDYNYNDIMHCSNLNKRDGLTWYPDMFIENQIEDYAIGNDKVMNYAINN
ncbi:peptidase S41 [Finegoldia magna]|uniref:peptidase S41 n=1 Tax=Finegoldia magna TaxID=1260 RepID=UPI000B9EF29E|nr:peptidase S41 [Finegoldia magna]OXZ28174.1 peptidase S41 [Finegoldia magna]